MSTKQSIFLGEEKSVYDSINQDYPELFELYKQQKAQDWSEKEFVLDQSQVDFEQCPVSQSDVMTKTVMWQWNGDGKAMHIFSLLAPFITNSEYTAACMKQSEIEVLHSLTYSEIVRQTIKNPVEALYMAQNDKAIVERSELVEGVLEELRIAGHKYALGMIEKDDPYLKRIIWKGLVAILILEGVNFQASFACTFALAEQGWFMGIAQFVQKIMLDEILHTKMDLAAIKAQMEFPEWRAAFLDVKDEIKSLLDEAVESEREWSRYIFSEGRAIVGLNSNLLMDWVFYNVKPLYDALGIQYDHKVVREIPMKFMNTWMEIDKQQNANQEQQTGGYLLNTVIDDVQDGEIL